jgi:chemotaxis protein methyltransferase CheR
LVDAWPPITTRLKAGGRGRQPFDAVFCRNVMIYFDEPAKERPQTRLAAQREPGGHLYIGHWEQLAPSVAAQFALVGCTMYRKVA